MRHTMGKYLFAINDDIALVDVDSSRLTYNELYDRSNLLSSILKSRNLVLCLCENSIASVVGYVAFLSNGVIPILYSHKTEKGLIDDTLMKYSPRYIYIPATRQREFLGYKNIYSYRNYVLLEKSSVSTPSVDEELALLMSTSGSTGSSKLVRLTYHNIVANSLAIANYLGIDKSQRPITTLPMNYVYGLFVINSHLISGATILLTNDSVIMKSFWEYFDKERATSIAGVPWTFEQLKRIRFFKMNLPSLQYMTQSGGKFSFELQEEFATWLNNHGKKLYVMYGQTEGTGRMFYLPSDKASIKIGSIGKPLSIGRAELIDEQGEVISTPDKEGELVYYGDNVSLGYANSSVDLSRGDENHGRLLTGDIAKMDSEGYFYIVGRKKRFLKIYGNRVSLDEVDRIVKSKFNNIDCASTGRDDRLVIYIDNEPYVKYVKECIATCLAISEKIIDVRYIELIPKNDSGKVLFSKLMKE